ncbi:uncharacterized mitochondrial protein-like protein [Tanacetum coccineum]|uniref:Uncharacterized mitochondrial protein-like protein n=1 Tax=Tanacetum coccineum TaxID=301880 RepID=A0ABQ5B6D6_9ASTR
MSLPNGIEGRPHVNFKNMNQLGKAWISHGQAFQNPSQMSTTMLPWKQRKATQGSYKKSPPPQKKISTAVSTISAPLQLLHMDLFGPTSIRSIDHKYYSLVVTDDFSRFTWVFFLGTKTPYELVSGKVPNISHLKPFGCLVTILNTSDYLGKFEGKADEGFVVGYAAYSKAYRVYNLSSKKIEETLNLRYLEEKPNVQGLGHEWYFDLDYLTDSLGYTRFKTKQPAGLKVNEASEVEESSSDYAEELARLQNQAHEANATAEKHLSQADLATSWNRVPTGKVDSAAGVTDGPTESSTPIFTPVHTDATSLPPGHSLGSSEHSTRYPSPSDLANSMSSSSKMEDIHHHSDTGIFSSSSYDDDFGGTVTNLAPSIVVDSVPTKRVNTIHPQSQILGDLTSPVQTRVYVDDIIFGSTNKAWCDDFEVLMKGEFEMSAMGELTFFLGLQVKQKPDGIFISQDKYVQDMLKKFDMESVRPATTPFEASKPKSKDEPDDAVNVHLYRSMIGSLMYLTASRPDIQFAVSACSRHQVTPLTSNLNAVKKIFKYLKGQPKLGLWYPRDSPFVLEAYSDSDYAGSHGDRKSTTGGCQFLGRRLISWQCKKQTIVATSSTEAEYVAAANCCGQVLKIHTDENVADLLTKAFDGPRFNHLVVHIGMLNP